MLALRTHVTSTPILDLTEFNYRPIGSLPLSHNPRQDSSGSRDIAPAIDLSTQARSPDDAGSKESVGLFLRLTVVRPQSSPVADSASPRPTRRAHRLPAQIAARARPAPVMMVYGGRWASSLMSWRSLATIAALRYATRAEADGLTS
jgi:hypothetical protein